MASERTVYLERTPWPTWVRVLFWGTNGVICLSVLAGWDTTLPPVGRVIVVGVVLAAAALMYPLLGGLTVRVQETGILVQLGTFGLLHRRVPFDEVLALRSVQYRPIREFGGWGIRGTRRRRAWSARGDEAVELELSGDRRLLIGSDRPRRLEDRIRSAMADREKTRG